MKKCLYFNHCVQYEFWCWILFANRSLVYLLLLLFCFVCCCFCFVDLVHMDHILCLAELFSLAVGRWGRLVVVFSGHRVACNYSYSFDLSRISSIKKSHFKPYTVYVFPALFSLGWPWLTSYHAAVCRFLSSVAHWMAVCSLAIRSRSWKGDWSQTQ